MESDLELLSTSLREIDVLEMRKLAGVEPLFALRKTFENSKFALCIRDRAGNPVAIMGIGWLPNPRAGIAWFLSTDVIDKVGLLFLQEARANLDDWMRGHDVISNFVYAKNETTVKWLKWLGFEILSERTTPHSDGDVFYEMAKFRSPVIRDLYRNRDWSTFVRAIDPQ